MTDVADHDDEHGEISTDGQHPRTDEHLDQPSDNAPADEISPLTEAFDDDPAAAASLHQEDDPAVAGSPPAPPEPALTRLPRLIRPFALARAGAGALALLLIFADAFSHTAGTTTSVLINFIALTALLLAMTGGVLLPAMLTAVRALEEPVRARRWFAMLWSGVEGFVWLLILIVGLGSGLAHELPLVIPLALIALILDGVMIAAVLELGKSAQSPTSGR